MLCVDDDAVSPRRHCQAEREMLLYFFLMEKERRKNRVTNDFVPEEIYQESASEYISKHGLIIIYTKIRNEAYRFYNYFLFLLLFGWFFGFG